MAKIIQFPTQNRQKQVLEDTIDKMQESLNEIYDAIRKVEAGYGMLKDQAKDLEEVYQDLVIQYSEAVGADNIPVSVLEYCNYVGMERDPVTGDIKIFLKPPEEDK